MTLLAKERESVMEVTLDIGRKKYVLKSDDNYLHQFKQVFEPHMVKLFGVIAKGNIVDVGANIGCTALLFSGLGERVDAFEPSPSTFEILKQNTGVEPNIFIHNLGLGDRVGRSQITFSANNRSGAFISKGIEVSDGHITEEIELSTLDEFIKNKKKTAVDFIKIDVEGFEVQVLRGGRKDIANI
jgi:FkbM family methyltransferase